MAAVKLTVSVQDRPVATLFRESGDYVLQYASEVAAGDFISLTMPVQAAPWIWPRDLHPFFRQNLPEGYLLSILREMLGPALDGTDLGLLVVVGAQGIGRVHVGPGHTPEPSLDVSTLLHRDFHPEYFDQLVRTYARSAVSGVMPKFLSPDAPGSAPEWPARATLRTSRYIVKSASHLPYLAFNEHYTLSVLRKIKGVPVVRTELSDDGQVLLVERFDVDERGQATHGVEDAASLLGLAPQEKYAPSMERVFKATEVYLPNATREAQLKQFAYHLLSNFVIRNGDCHAKNIALYYTSLDDVGYTPVYDLVTTQAYDGFRDATPGLSIAGRKSWQPGKTLPQFCASRLGIPPRTYQHMVEELCEAAVSVGTEIAGLAKQDRRWHPLVKNMLHTWERGIQEMRTPTYPVSLAPVLQADGFSDYDRPLPAPRTGESPLMASARRRSSPRVRKAKRP